MDDETRQELLGAVDPVIIEALDGYHAYLAEAYQDAKDHGKSPEIEPWTEYLTEYLLEELRSQREEN